MSRPADQLRPAIRAGIISKLPVGLLGFLGIKNGGEYPRELAGFYQPTLELGHYLRGVNFEERNPALNAVPAAANAGSFSTPVTVPDTEAWVVDMACMRVNVGVGEAWTGYLALRRFPVASPNVVHALCVERTTAFANVSGFPYISDYKPFIMGPGDELVAFSIAVTGAPQMRPHLRFARFPI